MSRPASDKRAALAALIAGETLVVAPGVYDMISARLADRLHFPALYLSGYGVAASQLGVPDAGLASLADVAERARVIATGTDTPLICDADTGFGGLLNIAHTVRELEAAGCAAIQLEDQQTPKRCGLTRGVRVVSVDEMIRRIDVALEARTDSKLLLVARTDAHGSLGLDAAIERGARYAQAGADVIFVQGIASEDDLRAVADRIERPCIVNITAPSGLGSLAPQRLRALGCRIAIHPGLAMLVATAAISAAYGALHRDGSLISLEQDLFDRDAMHRLMGFDEVWAFEKRWLDDA